MIFEIFRRELRRVGARARQIRVGVLPFHDDRHVLRVHLTRRLCGGGDVLRVLDHGRADRHVVRKADLRAGLARCADRLHREAVTENGVMPGLVEPSRRKLQPGRVDAVPIAQFEERTELVDREDVLDAIGQSLRNESCIVSERLGRVARLPAAAVVLQHLRQIPVIQRGKGLDAVGEQLVDQAAVEVHALWIRRAGPLRKDARPGDREAIDLDAQRLHQLHVVFVTVVVIVGHVAVGVVDDLAGRMGEGVPHRRRAAVFGDGAFDLVRGGGGSPQKARRKRSGCGGRCRRAGHRRGLTDGSGCSRRAHRGGTDHFCELTTGNGVGHRGHSFAVQRVQEVSRGSRGSRVFTRFTRFTRFTSFTGSRGSSGSRVESMRRFYRCA